MDKVNLIYVASDCDGIDFIENETVCRVDEWNIVRLVDNALYIEELDEETEEFVVADNRDHVEKYPIYIGLENVNLDELDIFDEAVVNFARYLLKIKEKM